MTLIFIRLPVLLHLLLWYSECQGDAANAEIIFSVIWSFWELFKELLCIWVHAVITLCICRLTENVQCLYPFCRSVHKQAADTFQWGCVRMFLKKTFLFSPSCSYFNENQYPDEAKREEIANACNAVIQKPGEELIAMSFPKAITIRFQHLLLNSVNVILWLLLIIQPSQLAVGFFSSLLCPAFFRAANNGMNMKVNAVFKPKYLYLKLNFSPVEVWNTRCVFHLYSFVNGIAKKINILWKAFIL